MKWGVNAHRICKNCYFGKDGKPGWAEEGGDHSCPGYETLSCLRQLHHYPKKKKTLLS